MTMTLSSLPITGKGKPMYTNQFLIAKALVAQHKKSVRPIAAYQTTILVHCGLSATAPACTQVQELFRFPPEVWNSDIQGIGDADVKLFRGTSAAWRKFNMLQLIVKLGTGRSRAAIATLISKKDHGFGYKEMLEPGELWGDSTEVIVCVHPSINNLLKTFKQGARPKPQLGFVQTGKKHCARRNRVPFAPL